MTRWLLVVVALASCTPTAAKIGLGVSGALVTGGAILAAQPDKGLGPKPSDVGAMISITGVVVAIPCIVRLLWPTSEPPPEPQFDPGEARRREIRDHRERAWKLTQEAAAAATSGHCDVALSLGSQIAEIDTDFHDTVYLHSAAIARCTAAP